ncbi:MAG TPA: tetratricopeptide repeat protein [Terriglobales bacterium]|nr:tetratricopeptide repeat protein [Terriglobales bacterium]
MKKTLVAVVLLISTAVLAQERKDTQSPQAQAPAKASADSGKIAPRLPDKAAAYYHYSLAHMYEELVSIYGRAEYATKAIQEYRAAIENDPDSEYLNAGLAELYAKTGRIAEAVREAQDILKRDPNNLEARKLLGRIYLRSLGDLQSGTQSQEVLKLAIEQFQEIVRLEPKSVDDHLLLGRLYRLDNDLVKAEDEFKAAIQIQPDSEEAITSLAYLYNEEGDAPRAIALLNQVPDGARSGKLYSALGYTYEQQKEYKKAVAAYRQAVELDRDNLESLRGLAQNLMNDGQYDAALEQYRQIAEADPQDAQSYLRISEIYRRQGKFDQALDMLKKAESLVQDSLEIPFNMALVYDAQGRFEDAATTLQQLMEKTAHPDGNYTTGERNNRSVFLERLGTVYREQGKSQAAVEAYRKMLELGGDSESRGYQQMIDTLREAKQWPQATAVAQESVQKLPNDRGLKLVLAGQLADTGQADEGLAMAKSLLKGTAEDREVYIALAQINSRLKRWSNAEEDINKAAGLASKQEDKDYVQFVLGSIYERQKRFEPAEAAFKKVLANDPRSAITLNYLGYMLADRGTHLDEALGYIKKAVELDPQNGAYLDSLGWAYFKLGNYDLAEENLRKASERIGNDATVQDHLGDVYQKMGRLKQAAAHWQRALEEWAKTVPADVDQDDVAKVQHKLEAARVKLAQQGR